jgi:hypothetical protein
MYINGIVYYVFLKLIHFNTCFSNESNIKLKSEIDNNKISLGDKLNMSSYLLNYNKTHNHIDKREVEEIRLSKHDHKIKYELISFNSISFARTHESKLNSLEFFIDGVKFNGHEIKPIEDYNYNITYSDNLVTPFEKKFVFYNDCKAADSKFDFRLYQPHMFASFKTLNFKEYLDNIISINNLIIGIDKKKK